MAIPGWAMSINVATGAEFHFQAVALAQGPDAWALAAPPEAVPAFAHVLEVPVWLQPYEADLTLHPSSPTSRTTRRTTTSGSGSSVARASGQTLLLWWAPCAPISSTS
jgi:hypothetical protein